MLILRTLKSRAFKFQSEQICISLFWKRKKNVTLINYIGRNTLSSPVVLVQIEEHVAIYSNC